MSEKAENSDTGVATPRSACAPWLFLLLVGCASTAKQAPPPDVAALADAPKAHAAPQASSAVREAEALLARGEAAQAKQKLTAALAADGQDARAELDLGLAHEALGEAAEAEAAYRRALAVDANFGEAHNNLGLLLRDQNKLDGAIEELGRAAAAKPPPEGVFENLALTYEDAGRTREAGEAYARAVREAPKNPMLRANYGLFLLNQKDPERAQAELRSGLANAEGNRAALIAIGNGLRRAGKPDEAVRALQQAVSASPQPASSAVHTELGLAQNAAGNAAGAKSSLAEAIKLDGKNAAAHYALASIFAQEGDVAQAKQHFKAVLGLNPGADLAARTKQKLAALENVAKTSR